MEETSGVAVNENGDVSSERHETKQIFLQIGHKVTKKETSLLYVDSNSDLKHEEDPQQLGGAAENGVEVDNKNYVREVVTETDLVVVKKTPVGQESNDDEPKEDDSATVQNLLMGIESVIDDTSAKGTEELTEDKGDAVEEDLPVVIEKRTVSHHVEHVIEPRGSEDTDEDDYENGINSEQLDESKEPIAEAEVVVVEKSPASLVSTEILDEKESAGDQPQEDDSTTVESLLVNIESVIDHVTSKQKEEPADEDKAEAVEEEAPTIIEKRPVSPSMQHVIIDHDEPEGRKNEAEDEKKPIAEAEPVVIAKTPVVCKSEFLVEIEGHEEPKVDDSTTVESLLVNIESAIDDTSQERTQQPPESKGDALEEDAPVVVEKRPASFYVENITDSDETEEWKDEDEGAAHAKDAGGQQMAEMKEPISEAEVVVVKKTPVALESQNLVEADSADDEPKEGDDATVESLLVNIESVMDDTALEAVQKSPESKGDALVEDAPVVIEKGPVSFHIEHVIDHDEEVQDDDGSGEKEAVSKEPIEEAEVVVVEKTPAVLESEILVENESANDEHEEDKSTTVESLLVNIESAIDRPPSDNAVEPTHEDKAKVLEEDTPVVIEKRPASLHIEHVSIQDEDVQEAEGKQAKEPLKEPVSEAELVAIEKAPAAMETEMLVEQEVPKDDNSTVASLLVNIESVIGTSLPQQRERGKKDSEDSVQETVPPAVEKQPSEMYQELLQTLETAEQTPEGADNEVNVPETDILDDEERLEPVKDGEKIYDQQEEEEPKLTEVVTTEKEISTITITTKQITQTIETGSEKEGAGDPVITVTTTEESSQLTSYKKLVHRDEGDDENELFLQVVKRRLSDPEVLPEKENDGSAPLAPSESGIHDSKERIIIEDTRAKDSPTKGTEVKPEAVPSDTEPYKAVSDEEKLIDTLEDVDVADNAKSKEEPLSVVDDEQELLDTEDELKADRKEAPKKGKKGLSSPQCKCCSLM